MIEKLGRYRVIKELGRGSGGVVYHCVDTDDNEEWAIKTSVISDFAGSSDKTRVERLKREAESISMLKHPNIVRVRGLEEDNGQIFLVMELVRGRSLEEAIRKGEKFVPEEAARIITAVASALDFAHRSEMVHRDVKPANIMLSADGNVKIMDFGAVKMTNPKNYLNLTMAGTTVGSPHYMSPEQVIRGVLGGSSDQFSLAVVAYQLLTGRRPFEAESLAAVIYQIADHQHPPLTSVKQDLPATLEPVFEVALSKAPDQRYPTCSKFAEELSAALDERPSRSGLFAGAISAYRKFIGKN